MATQHLADRRSDLAFGKDPGGHLIQQRLEQVVVGPVDEGDVHRDAPEELRREQTGESPADDQDARLAARAHRGLTAHAAMCIVYHRARREGGSHGPEVENDRWTMMEANHRRS